MEMPLECTALRALDFSGQEVVCHLQGEAVKTSVLKNPYNSTKKKINN